MAVAEQVLAVAQRYIGVVEQPNNDVIFNTRYYGHPVNGAQYPWCGVFCYEVFKEANASNLFCGGQKTALCQFALDYYRKHKQFYTTNPQSGDLVFFKFGTTTRETNHMGFVESVNEDGSIVTIEGNTSDANQTNGGMVMRKTRRTNIVGYARPDYKEDVLPMIYENVYPQKGVDVAAWQKNVNYKALRMEGVKFAVLKIIRKDLKPDEMFEVHYKGFQEAGIPIRCVYNYSYATTVEKAKIDAHRVIDILKGRQIPVALDIEDNAQKNIGERLPQIINAYQSVIQGAGLKFCVYTGLSFFQSYIKPYLDILSNTQFWIARYPSKADMLLNQSPDISKKPDVKGLIAWQYTSTGKIPSAYNGPLDFDILYSPIIAQTRKIATVLANSLRIRSTPNTSNNKNIVGYLKKGDNVIIYATDLATGWFQIDLEGKQWISNNSQYVRLN